MLLLYCTDYYRLFIQAKMYLSLTDDRVDSWKKLFFPQALAAHLTIWVDLLTVWYRYRTSTLSAGAEFLNVFQVWCQQMYAITILADWPKRHLERNPLLLDTARSIQHSPVLTIDPGTMMFTDPPNCRRATKNMILAEYDSERVWFLEC